MAFRATYNAILIDSLIADLVQEVINKKHLLAKESKHTRIVPCQMLFDIMGIVSCGQNDDGNESNVPLDVGKLTAKMANQAADDPIKTAMGPIPFANYWHNQILAADSSEDDLEIYLKRKVAMIGSTTVAVQTEQPRKRIREHVTIVVNNRPTQNIELPPCELTRHIVYIDAISVPAPSLQNRPPLADRFCYMLTDFASALYCSLAIMCCCTPSMLR